MFLCVFHVALGIFIYDSETAFFKKPEYCFFDERVFNCNTKIKTELES